MELPMLTARIAHAAADSAIANAQRWFAYQRRVERCFDEHPRIADLRKDVLYATGVPLHTGCPTSLGEGLGPHPEAERRHRRRTQKIPSIHSAHTPILVLLRMRPE